MRSVLLYILFFSIIQQGLAQSWQSIIDNADVNYYQIRDAFYKEKNEKGYEKSHGWKQFKRWEHFWKTRVLPDGSFPVPGNNYYEVQDFLQKTSAKISQKDPQWKALGPSSAEQLPYGTGRVDCIAFHPNDTNILFIGAPSGGLWKTTDGGQSWTTSTDNLPVLGISDIIIDHTDPDIMYIATGDRDHNSNASVGILRSFDGGENWDTTGMTFSYPQFNKIYKLLIHPENPNILFAGTNIGIFKTTDAGNTWTNTFADIKAYDIEFKPGDPSVLYASGSGKIYRSVDTGNVWNELTNGIPLLTEEKAQIAVTAADPEYLYFLTCEDYNFGGLYRSTDGGDSFTLMQGYAELGGFTWYVLTLAVSQYNVNEIYIGGVKLYRSTDGGDSFTLAQSLNIEAPDYIHVDFHYLGFRDSTLFSGNDGGIYKSYNDGISWTDISNGLSVHQVYRIGGYHLDENLFYTGSQDNGTSRFRNNIWERINGADGMETIINYNDPEIVYLSIQNGVLLKSVNGGINIEMISLDIDDNGPWITPYVLDPVNPEILYAGYRNVWKSSDEGNSWEKISDFTDSITYITSLEIASSDPNCLYLIKNNILYRTMDGGSTWESIDDITGHPITSLEIDPEDPERIWITISGYQEDEKVFESPDGGDSWINITGELPNITVNCIVFEKNNSDALYIGTDLGVYYTNDSLDNWISYSDNLPNVVINELEIHYASKKIRAATYGRGVWEAGLVPNAYSPPDADFEISDPDICTGDTVIFHDISDNFPESWEWIFTPDDIDFVNGTDQYSQNPEICFNNDNEYDVTLIVSNQYGYDTITKQEFIKLPVKAEFSSDKNICNENDTIFFTDLSSCNPVSWNWNITPGTVTFINGTDPSSQNPALVFNEPGEYTVALTATNITGSDTMEKPFYIKVENKYLMCHDLYTNAPSGTLFDSGGPFGSYGHTEECGFLIDITCAFEVTVFFKSFNVCPYSDYIYIYEGPSDTCDLLLIDNGLTLPDTVISLSGKVYIKFISDNQGVYPGFELSWTSVQNFDTICADFTLSDANPLLNTPVEFTDHSTTVPVQWLWNFGDGYTSNEQNPVHNYTVSGANNIKLISGNCHTIDSAETTIIVQQPPDIEIIPDSVYVHITECNDSSIVPVSVVNKGNGSLVYDPGEAENVVSGVLIKEDFEDGELDGWTIDPTYYDSTKIVSDDPAVGNYCLKVEGGISTIHEGVFMHHSGVQPTNISFYIKIPDSTGAIRIIQFDDDDPGALEGMAFMFIDDSLIILQGLAGQTDQVFTQYNTEEWYFIEFRSVNYQSRTFDYYINGELIMNNIGFCSETLDYLSHIYFVNFGYSSIYVDDILLGFSDWVVLNTIIDTLPPGDTIHHDLMFYSTDMLPGIYSTNILFSSNDPDDPVVALPCTLDLDFNLCPDFYYSVSECNGNVRFISALNSNADTFLWDFGDGQMSFEPDPSHIYDSTGNYDVKLTIENTNGTDSIIKNILIEDIAGPDDPLCVPVDLFSPITNGISYFGFNTINNQDYSDTIYNCYIDLSCIYSTEVEAGQTYTMTVQNDSASKGVFAAWIDYNNDRYFDSTETVMFSDYANFHYGEITISDSVVFNTPLRMRIGQQYDSLQVPMPCMNYLTNQYEDYTVVITPGSVNINEEWDNEAGDDYYELCIFPNPSAGYINILYRRSTDNDLTIKIFNSQGRHIYIKRFYDLSREMIDISYLPAGIYYLKAIGEQHIYMKKLVIYQ